MAIVIEQVLCDTARGVRAVALHAGRRLELEVVGERGRIEGETGRALIVELGFDAVCSWRVSNDDPSAHGLFSADGTDVRIVGAVHNVFDLDGQGSLVDVYVASGPELLTLELSDLSGQRPAIGTCLELIVVGLACYPTWT